MYIYIYRERESARARANEVPTSREEAGRMLLNTGATMESEHSKADTVTGRQYLLDTCILILIFIIVLR